MIQQPHQRRKTDGDRPFSFGKNWQSFLASIDEARIDEAKESLSAFIGIERIRGKTFLDIGSGSGLFSYAAHALGAARIVSFDVDPFSVACTQYLRERAGSPEHWRVLAGSVLDGTFLASLGTFDVVYSWGVLHHTGDLWTAVERAAERVAPDGTLDIAIYHRGSGLFGSRFWLAEKRLYNRSPRFVQKILEVAFKGTWLLRAVLTGKNPATQVRTYRSKRGMDWHTDVIDWLGGLPYQYATIDEVTGFFGTRLPTFHLQKTKCATGLGNHEFLFQRTITSHA